MPQHERHEPHEDMDLENAIGEVFDQFDLSELNHNESHGDSQHQSQEPHPSLHHQSESVEEGDGPVLDRSGLPNPPDANNIGDAPHNLHRNMDHESPSTHPKPPEEEGDEAFEAAINDAFQSLQDSQTDHQHHQSPLGPQEDSHKHNDIDAQGNASGMLDHPESIHDETDNNQPSHEEAEAPNPELLDQSRHDDGDDIDLANAITDAIESINPKDAPEDHHSDDQDTQKTDASQQQSEPMFEHQGSDSSNRQEENPSSNYSPLEIEKRDYNDEDKDDLDLQNAIGNAFESIKDKQEEVDDDGLSKVITESFQNLVSHDKSHPKNKIQMNDVVSNLVSQINDENRSNNISEDMLQELAQEITNQVQFQEDSDQLISRRRSLNLNAPKIDEQILNHFVNDAHRDKERLQEKSQERDKVTGTDSDIHQEALNLPTRTQQPSADKPDQPRNDKSKPNDMALSDPRFQSTMANVVKKVMANDNDKEEELNNLEMNDILTNAFNMAMENPTELLNNLEADDVKLDRFKTKDLNQRRLSIAETLALHRSKEREKEKEKTKQDGPAKVEDTAGKEQQTEKDTAEVAGKQNEHANDNTVSEAHKKFKDSHVVPSEIRHSIIDKPEDINSQLSSVISNISQVLPPSDHLTGNNDRNLVTIIKSMTSFLTNSNFQVFKSSQSLISIINNYKGNELEPIFVNSLNLAKDFLNSQKREKSTVAIDNVLILFGKHSTNDNLNHSHSLVSLVSNSVLNVICNFSTLKSFKNLYAKKLELNPIEYKERIRLENRERKKRWREENSERNKDNDLRARVTRKAHKLFGAKESQEKTSWVEDEFNKRRERRLAKQRETEQKGNSDEPSSYKYDQYTNDKQLIDIITDFFNVFSNFAPKNDPETGLKTASVAIASVAIIYLLVINPDLESKRIDGIMNSLMTNLINTFTSLEQQERLIYLAKGSSNNKLEHLEPLQLETSDSATIPDSTTYGNGNGKEKSYDETSDANMNHFSSQDDNSLRRSDPTTASSFPQSSDQTAVSFKRLREEDVVMQETSGNGNKPAGESEIKSKSDAIFSRISSTLKEHEQPAKKVKLDEGNAIRPADHPSHTLLTSNVRLPPYKPDSKRDYNSNIAKKEATLKKPGAFQRPSFNKSDKKERGFGFPSFYSTSIRH